MLPSGTHMSDYSLNETASRARLAAKGAGYPWGLADEVYRSVYWLARYNFPAPAILANLLNEIDKLGKITQAMPIIANNHYKPNSEFICPVMFGCALTDRVSDLNESTSISFRELRFPLLSLPFAAEVASAIERVGVLEFGAHRVHVDNRYLRLSPSDIASIKNAVSGELHFVQPEDIDFQSTEQLTVKNRVNISTDVWQSLDEWAHRTYAPATEASRLSGAGAGVLDND